MPKCVACSVELKKLQIDYSFGPLGVLVCPECCQLYYDEEANHEVPELLDQDGQGSTDGSMQRQEGLGISLSQVRP